MFIEQQLSSLQESISQLTSQIKAQDAKLVRIAEVVEKMLPDTMTTVEIASALGCHKVTVQKLFKSGVLQNVSRSKTLRATREQVTELIKTGFVQTPGAAQPVKKRRGVALYASAPARLK